MDRKCAEKLKGSSYDYRKSIGLLTNTEKYGSIAGLGTNYLEKCKRGC
ncbi:hypothetical protein KYB31_21195 [Clostridium felsineum]|nr:hypothetical protein [Clostridium felsineum]MCR3761492.1 hypothetical protein [Clostridium felsineum]